METVAEKVTALEDRIAKLEQKIATLTQPPTGELNVTGNGSYLRIDQIEAGQLKISSNQQNLIKAHVQKVAVINAGVHLAGGWTINYSHMGFEEVYACFAVLQGFSVWPQDASFHHLPPLPENFDLKRSIPHLVYVQVDAFDMQQASGRAYCRESDPNLEGDNEVLFTLVVLGRV